jgi:hypothetical protein
MDLFTYIDSLFDKQKYKDVTNAIKKKHSFMLMHYMSIQFPKECVSMNHIRSNEIVVSDFCHQILTKKYTKKPNWIYLKNQAKDNSIKKLSFTKSELIEYKNSRDLSDKDFDFLFELYPTQIEEDIKNFQKYQKEKD